MRGCGRRFYDRSTSFERSRAPELTATSLDWLYKTRARAGALIHIVCKPAPETCAKAMLSRRMASNTFQGTALNGHDVVSFRFDQRPG